MAASPGCLFLDCSETDDPCGLLKIKCPPCGEKFSLVNLCTKPEHKPLALFLRYANGKFYLKTMHKYYYQIQGQLYITSRSWCDFVVCTLSYTSIECIWFDSTLWSKKMYQQLRVFYMNSLLPELISPNHPSGQLIRESAPFLNFYIDHISKTA